MKILQITSSFLPVLGGQEKVVFETAKRLTKLGHEVTVLTTDLFCEGENLPIKETMDGFNIIRLKNKFLLKGYGYSSEAKKWLKENWKNYDLVHSHGYNRFLSEWAIFYLRNKLPLVFSPHGFRHTKKNFLAKSLHDCTVGRFVKFADKCTALTEKDYEFYNGLGISEKNIVDLHNGVDIEKFDEKNQNLINKLRKKYNLMGQTLLYVGRIHESKGLQYVIKTLRSLDCKLLIVGKDYGYKSELEKQIKIEKVQDKVVFAGQMSDEELIASYHLSDIFVLFSEWEGFGIVIVEAMAAGIPLVVSNRGSLPSLVGDGVEGFVVPFKDVGLLEDRLKILLNSKKKMQELGAKAKLSSKNYSWDKIIKNLLKIYDSVK